MLRSPLSSPLKRPLQSPLAARRGGVPDPAPPVNVSLPSIIGTPAVGSEVTANQGGWTGYPSISYTYQWRRDGVNISGATAQTYTIQAADYETSLTVVVSATNTEGGPVTATSPAVSVIGVSPSISGVPTISGTAEVGQTLTASAAGVTGYPVPSRTWQWLRDGSNISGATSSTYTLVSADGGTDVSVRQTETNALGFDLAVSSVVSVVGMVFSPSSMFDNGEDGAWYDPSDLSTVWQDDAGTIPAVAGSFVSRIDDKSGNGRHCTQMTGCTLVQGYGGRHFIRMTSLASPVSRWQMPEMPLTANFSYFYGGGKWKPTTGSTYNFYNFQRSGGTGAGDAILQSYSQTGTHFTIVRFPANYTVSQETPSGYLPALANKFVTSNRLGANFRQFEEWVGGRVAEHNEGARAIPSGALINGNLRIGYGYNDGRDNADHCGFIWINRETTDEETTLCREYMKDVVGLRESLYFPFIRSSGLYAASPTLINDTYDAFGFGLQADNGTHYYFARRGPATHVGDGGVICKWAYDPITGWSSATEFEESGMELRNAAGGKASNGTVVVFYGKYDFDASTPAWDSIRARRSTDNCATWSSEISISNRSMPVFSPYGPLVQLPSGRLMQTIYGINSPTWESWVTFSDDNGQTWGNESLIVSGNPGTGLLINETAACWISGTTDANSKIIAIARNETTQRIMRQYVSGDGGQTWTDQGPLYFSARTSGGRAPNDVSPWVYLDGDTIHLVWAARNDVGFYHTEGNAQDVFDSPNAWKEPESVGSKFASVLLNYGYPSFYKAANGQVVLYYYDETPASNGKPVIWSSLTNP
jgi:hypothetical protein